MSELLLEARGIWKHFGEGEEKTTVLKHISLQVYTGERIGIVGASGAGKSTLLHVLSTLEKPSQGEIFWKGELPLHKLSEKDLCDFRNREVGFVFQFHHLLEELSALENVMLPALIGGYSFQEAKKKALSLLEEVRLSHRLDHRPSELSGGEKQRVAVCRAVMMEPSVIFADEPTGNLDSENAQRVIDILFRMQEEHGATLFLVTHETTWTQSMHRVYHIQDGRLFLSRERP